MTSTSRRSPGEQDLERGQIVFQHLLGDNRNAAFAQGVLEGEEINPGQFPGARASDQAARV